MNGAKKGDGMDIGGDGIFTFLSSHAQLIGLSNLFVSCVVSALYYAYKLPGIRATPGLPSSTSSQTFIIIHYLLLNIY